ncbi:uncharacterized protein METZ01_LOCUS437752, partial [marine metagenome]
MYTTHTETYLHRIVALALTSVLVLSSPLVAQNRDTRLQSLVQSTDSTWNVTQARGRVYEVDFTTDEGTWMSVDVSPDGAWVAFNLLGHIYRMPSAGGSA